jgi:hypothetical protein
MLQMDLSNAKDDAERSVLANARRTQRDEAATQATSQLKTPKVLLVCANGGMIVTLSTKEKNKN